MVVFLTKPHGRKALVGLYNTGCVVSLARQWNALMVELQKLIEALELALPFLLKPSYEKWVCACEAYLIKIEDMWEHVFFL